MQNHLQAASFVLLAFAVLAFGIGAIEDNVIPMWVAPGFATWAVLIAAGPLNDLYRPPIVAIAAAALGVGVSFFKLMPIARIGVGRKYSFITYSLPLYATALIGAVLTGVFGSLSDMNKPFYGAVPDALLVYAVVAFAVLLYERRPGWLWLAAGLAAWGTTLAVQLVPIYVLLIGAGAAAAALLAGRVIKIAPAKAAAAALGIMLVERLPELLVFPVGLAAWAIWLWYPPLDIAPLMIAYSGLCILVFASQLIWKVIPPVQRLLPVGSLHNFLGLGGQSIVVLVIALQGGLVADAGMLAHVGAAFVGPPSLTPVLQSRPAPAAQCASKRG